MGAWSFVAPRLEDTAMVGWRGEVIYAGRPEAASPAEGSKSRHKEAQARLLAMALRDVSEPGPASLAELVRPGGK